MKQYSSAAQQWTDAGPVKTVIESTEIARLETASEASIGDPGAMGLFGFALGTTVLAWVLAGWAALPGSFIGAAPALLTFAGIGLFIAGLFAFARANTWKGTMMCVYGANNVIIAAFMWMQSGGAIPPTFGNMLLLAVDLFCMGYISLALMLGALRLNWAYTLLTGALAIGYTLTGIQFLGSARELGILGGYFLLAAAFCAFYAATAHVVNSSWRQEVLPIFSLRR